MLALHLVPGIGDFLIKQLISYCGSAEEVFRLPKGKLMKVPGVGPVTAMAIANRSTFDLAEDELQRAAKEDTHLLFFTDKAFPQRLRQYDDCPPLLYVKGNTNLNTPKTVGIVGTRQATDYGKAMVEKIVEDLKVHQPTIISGLAYGIDVHAHKLALQCGLPTIGVMGNGMDIVYPALHRDIAKRMLSQGSLITEHPFGTKPDAHNFPARNRIIAAMSDALIVVEAAEKGGALITAEIANSYNKDVFAVPGAVGQPYSEGCNKLIKTNRAHLLTSVKDVEYIMNWEVNGTASAISDPSVFEGDEKLVVTVLRERSAPMMIDEISIKTSLPHGMLASLLLGLEFKNVVSALPGKMYRLTGKA